MKRTGDRRPGVRRWAIASLLLAACSNREAPPQPGDAHYPKANPAPREVLQIEVTAPPDLQVAFAAHYTTERDVAACRTVHSRVAGASSAQRIRVPLTLQRGADGQASVRVAIDAFEPGRCQWRFDGVAAQVGATSRPETMTEQGDAVVVDRPSPVSMPDTPHRNGDPAQPVTWRCLRTLGTHLQTGQPQLDCNRDVAESGVKYQHRWRAGQHRLQMRLQWVEAAPSPSAAAVP